MIKLLSNGEPNIDLTILKDTESDRQVLIDLKRHEKLGDSVIENLDVPDVIEKLISNI